MKTSVGISLRIARFSPCCSVLGPGRRAVVWVQGCPFRCRECVAPETLPFEGGEEVSLAELARRILTRPDISGVTFSGGEPMMQAEALSSLLDILRSERDFSAMCYTGFTLAQLRDRPPPGALSLLDRLDLLIDGHYLPELHSDHIWRGSSNQIVHFLTPKHEVLRSSMQSIGNALEFETSQDGSVGWMGIPVRGFRTRFEQAMLRQGISLSPSISPPQ